MSDFFTLQNWLDFSQEESFWPTMMILCAAGVSLGCFLFSDMIRRYRAEHAERTKRFYWTRHQG